ncbi:P-loop containing nucleoside triphosphate hydrolase protein [Acrodontium crateriforme]|uniref:P-loop containing nucleoside triphosphate hydrolase protein n=1 Tax=Acrodontium crateriforme TaxID=150365 RepID=A0AAQ3M200_9PEZI|nr:P-loop containing nucleoside triphosphate hydrolase protein [Acrodontium crateriforme]
MAPKTVIKPEPHGDLQFDRGYATSSESTSEFTPTPVYPHLPVSSGETVLEDITMSGVNATDTDYAHGASSGGHVRHAISHTSDSTTTGTLQEPLAADEAMHALSQDSHLLIKKIQKLSTLGIDNTLSSLPKFVVVGDQSAGKSSIIEATCDIKLPRGPGTCTRCPFRITVTSSGSVNDDWTCIVSLQQKYSYVPGSRTSRYDNWSANQDIQLFQFGRIISDKSKLEDVLRRAQLAILNPGIDSQVFASPQFSIKGKESNQVEFSPNFITLEIRGFDLPELSFFDLPGVINVHKDANSQHLVEFVKELTREYLSDEKALILLAVAAEQDINNSTTFSLVMQCNALARCMGVLTKPDLLSNQQFETVREMLACEQFEIGGGWHLTKQLSQKELDSTVVITNKDARHREKSFFSQHPWSTELAKYQSRFGIINLQKTLSKELTEHIRRELPQISRRVQDRLEKVQKKLSEFAEKPQHASYRVMDEISTICQAVTRLIDGEDQSGQFSLEYRGLLKAARANFAAAAPQVVFVTPGYTKPSISIEEDDEDDEPIQTPKSRKGNAGQQMRTPQASIVTPTRPRKVPQSSKSTFKPSQTIFRLNEVNEALDQGSNSMLPGAINPKIRDAFIKKSVQGWNEITCHLMEGIETLMLSMLNSVIEQVLSSYSKTMLFTLMNKHVQKLAETLIADQKEKVAHLVKCEQHRPITYADIGPERELKREELRKKRLFERVNEYCETMEAKGAIKVPKFAERKSKMEEIGARIPPDEYTLALHALEIVPVYYNRAAASLIDTIAKLLEFGLRNALKTTMAETLRQELRVMDEDYCIQLLAEHPEREAERSRLLAEKDKLEIALDELKSLQKS